MPRAKPSSAPVPAPGQPQPQPQPATEPAPAQVLDQLQISPKSGPKLPRPDREAFQLLPIRNHDAAQYKRHFSAQLDRICAQALDQLEAKLPDLAPQVLAITTGIMLDKRLALEQSMNTGQAMTKQVITVNGLNRADAMAFLNGGAGAGANGNESQHDVSVTISKVETVPAPAQEPALASSAA